VDSLSERRWSRSILLVEDDEDFRVGLAELLRSEGYLVTCAANGLEALEYLRNGAKPNLVLLDLMMPVMSGWDFRAKMLEESALASIPVILLSASVSEPDAASLRATAYLNKPFNLDSLLEMIDGTLLDRCAACGASVAEGRKTVSVHGAAAAVLCKDCEFYDEALSRDLQEVLDKTRRARRKSASAS
jgi:CheY-like chemotaxis protein